MRNGICLSILIFSMFLSGIAFATLPETPSSDALRHNRQVEGPTYGEISERSESGPEQPNKVMLSINKIAGLDLKPGTVIVDDASMLELTGSKTKENLNTKKNYFSSETETKKDTDDNAGPVKLPNALWILGGSILWILSVRKTQDDSNVT